MFQRIEFMGLPGSGKTTCSALLLKSIRRLCPAALAGKTAVREGIRRRDDGIIRNVVKKFPPVVWEPLSGMQNAMAELHRFACRHAPLMAHVFQALCADEMDPGIAECASYDFFRVAAEHQLTCDHFGGGDIVVFEEGFGQVGCLLLGYLRSGQVSASAIERYVRALPPLQAVVWVDTEPEICLARLEQRPRMTIGLVDEPRERCLEVLAQSQAGFAGLADEMSRCGVAVHRVRNGDPSAGDLMSALSRVADAVASTGKVDA